MAVLLALAEGPLTLRRIAAAPGIDAPYATVIVGKLEARGLVLRTPHPAGHRRKLVSLTGAGRKAAAQAREITARPPPSPIFAAELAALDAIGAKLAR